MRRAAIAAAGLLLVALPARGDGPLALHGYLDVGFVYDDALPTNGRVGGYTTMPLHLEPAINVASLAATLTLGSFHAHLAVGAGAALEALHARDPFRPPGSEAWRYLLEARAGYTLPIGRGLDIEAGLFPSHIGFEVFPTKDNWNTTHGWMAEFTPLYQAGVRIAYSFTEHLRAKLLWLNGWSLVEQDYGFRSGGAQLAWSSPLVIAAVNLFVGPARPNDRRDVRWLGDLHAELHPIAPIRIAAAFEFALEPRPDGKSSDTWYAGAVWIRYQFFAGLAAAVRAEVFDDRDGGLLTGSPQRLMEFTLTLELARGPFLLRAEGRADRSTAATLDGQTGRELLLFQGVAAF